MNLPTSAIPATAQLAKGYVFAVQCSANCETIGDDKVGMADDIKYTVVVQGKDGPLYYKDVVPNHRRPMVKLIAARPGDVVDVCWFGLTPKFSIVEVEYVKDCE